MAATAGPFPLRRDAEGAVPASPWFVAALAAASACRTRVPVSWMRPMGDKRRWDAWRSVACCLPFASVRGRETGAAGPRISTWEEASDTGTLVTPAPVLACKPENRMGTGTRVITPPDWFCCRPVEVRTGDGPRTAAGADNPAPTGGTAVGPVAVGDERKLLVSSGATAAPRRGDGMKRPVCCGKKAFSGKEGSMHPAVCEGGTTP